MYTVAIVMLIREGLVMTAIEDVGGARYILPDI